MALRISSFVPSLSLRWLTMATQGSSATGTAEAQAHAKRSRSSERYYRPNFPVVLAADRDALQPVLEDLAADIAAVFQQRQEALANALTETSLSARGEPVELVHHYLYTTATRLARGRLEADGALPPWPDHADGSRWIWWAEEAPETEVR